MLGIRFCQVRMEGIEDAHFLFLPRFLRIESGFGFVKEKK